MGYQSNLVATVGTPYFWCKSDQTPFVSSGSFATTISTTGTVNIVSGGIEGSYAQPSTSTASRVTSVTSGVYRSNPFSFNIWIKSNSKPAANTAWAPYVTSISYTATIATGAYIGTDGIVRYGQVVNNVQTPILTGGTIDVCDGNWHMITFTRNGATAKLYVDGSLQASSTSWVSTSTVLGTTVNFFQSESSHQVLFDEYSFHASELTAANISTIFSGYVSALNVLITETPATATNAHFPEPAISTEIGISLGTEPGTATAEISYLSVSGSVNYEPLFASASALMTEPTLAFTLNDNTEIFTSITASAEFIDPFNFGGQSNVSTTAQLMEASADIEQHTVIAAATLDYFADLVGSASGLMIEPFSFGPTDKTIIALPMTAFDATLGGQATVQISYFSLVKKHDPLIYYYGSNVNYGTSAPTTFTKDSGFSYSSAGFPLSSVNDGNAYMFDINASSSASQLTWGGQLIPDLKTAHLNREVTYEYWFNPQTNNWSTGVGSFIFTNGYFIFRTTNNLSQDFVEFQYSFQGGISPDYTYTVPRSLFPKYNWNHLVVVLTKGTPNQSGTQALLIRTFLNSSLISSFVTNLNPTTEEQYINAYIDTFSINPQASQPAPGACSYDEIAIYSKALSISDIIEHYNFISTLSPNRLLFAEEFNANVIFPEPDVIAVQNKNFPATPITASALMRNETLDVQRYINIAATPITASAQAIEPVFYGTPDYRKDAEPLIAYAEMSNGSYALNNTYFQYVKANVNPYRYVSFDSGMPSTDYGTDTDYAVIPTVFGGEVTLPSIGINNKSILTYGVDYTTDGVILKESEYNDTWGTGTDEYHSSFWMQKADNDTSSPFAIRVLWNLHSAYDNKHVILYQYNNRLYLNFNNQSGNSITQATVLNINVFDGLRHFIAIDFDHNGANIIVNLWVDGLDVMSVNIGQYSGTTINGITFVGPNDEANNKPRLAVGCLVTPFANTSLPLVPEPAKIYIDEVYWAKTGLTQTLATNLFNIMPIRTNKTWYADFFLAQNATLVNPTFGAGCTINATVLTASAIIVNPTVFTEYGRNIGADPMQASALAVEPGFFGDDVREINFAAEFMFASALLFPPTVVITLSGQTMQATIKLVANAQPYFDPYHQLIVEQSIMSRAAVLSDAYRVGDLDSND